MGDVRYGSALRAIKEAPDRATMIRDLSDGDVIAALAASAREREPYLSNILATEAHNRLLRLRAVTESMEDSVFVVSAEGRPLYVNRAGERMFSDTRENLLSPETSYHLDAESAARYRARIADAMGREGSARVEVEMRRADGSTFWTEQAVTRLTNTMGEVVGHVCIVRDASEQHAMREEMRRANELLEAVFTAAPVPIACVDRDLRFLRANAQVGAALGLREEEIVGKRMFDIVEDAPPDAEALLRSLLETGLGYDSTAARDAYGRKWDWLARPLYERDGTVRGLLIMAFDVTDRREGVHRFVPA